MSSIRTFLFIKSNQIKFLLLINLNSLNCLTEDMLQHIINNECDSFDETCKKRKSKFIFRKVYDARTTEANAY